MTVGMKVNWTVNFNQSHVLCMHVCVCVCAPVIRCVSASSNSRATTASLAAASAAGLSCSAPRTSVTLEAARFRSLGRASVLNDSNRRKPGAAAMVQPAGSAAHSTCPRHSSPALQAAAWGEKACACVWCGWGRQAGAD